MKKRAFIYRRVSTTKQEEDGAGLDVQLKVCQEFAEREGYEVVRVFTDAYTGYQYRDRPALSEMRELVRNHAVDAVIFYAVDRLARKQAHVAILMDECEHAVVDYVFVSEPFDKSAIGMLILGARAFAAELEREKIIARTQGGLRNRVDNGMPLVTCRPPYGYKWVTTPEGKKIKLVIDEETAAVVRRIYHDLVAGKSAHRIAQELMDDKIPTPLGGRWVSSNISALVKKTTYKGEYRAYRYSGLGELRGKKPKGGSWALKDGIVLPDAVPAIVTPELWEAAIVALTSRRRQSSRNNANPEASLLRSGFMVCGYCGNTVCAKNERTRHDKRYGIDRLYPRVYVCSPNNRAAHGCPGWEIKGDDLDAAVWNLVVETMRDPKKIEERLQNRTTNDTTEYERAIVEKRLAATERKQKNLRASLADIDDEDTRAQLIADANELGKLRKQLLEDLVKLNAEHEQWKASQEQVLTVRHWCRIISRRLELNLSYDQKREVLHALGVKVRAWRKGNKPHRVVVEWGLPSGGSVTESLDSCLFENTNGWEHIFNEGRIRLIWTDVDLGLTA